MKKTLTRQKAVNMLLEDTNANRTREEADAIIEYYEELEDATGEIVELDVVSIRCEWSSYTIQEMMYEYAVEGENKNDVLEYIRENTQVIDLDDSILMIDF